MEFSYKAKRTVKYRHGSTEKSKTTNRHITLKLKDLPKISIGRTVKFVVWVLKTVREVVTKLVASGGILSQKRVRPEVFLYHKALP